MIPLDVSDLRALHARMFEVGTSATEASTFSETDASRALDLAGCDDTIRSRESSTATVLEVACGLIVGLASSPPVESGRDRLAAFAASMFANSNGHDLALEPADPMFRRIYEEAAQHKTLSEPTKRFLNGRIKKYEPKAVLAVQLELPGMMPLPPEPVEVPSLESGINGYVASALTNTDATQLSTIECRSAMVADVLASDKITVHQPTLHTHPRTHATVAAFQVQELDYSCVVNADVVVVLADVPSFGVGLEMAWAVGTRSEVVVLAESGTEMSKLVLAATGNVSILRFDSDADLSHVLGTWISENMGRLERHRDARLLRESLYGGEWADLRAEVHDVSVDELAAAAASMSITRIQEIVKSPSHFGNATRDELAGIKVYVAEARANRASPPPRRDASLFDLRQLIALEDAAEIYDWSPTTVSRLREVGRELLESVGVHRITLASPADWNRLWEATPDV